MTDARYLQFIANASKKHTKRYETVEEFYNEYILPILKSAAMLGKTGFCFSEYSLEESPDFYETLQHLEKQGFLVNHYGETVGISWGKNRVGIWFVRYQ